MSSINILQTLTIIDFPPGNLQQKLQKMAEENEFNVISAGNNEWSAEQSVMP